mmetsp:Transcript_44149/g.101959  ORF Transcript_44149/g.101959 Transcript_44149/m.101959 type:complete len:190 (+) Transcript_44149:42-611(+)
MKALLIAVCAVCSLILQGCEQDATGIEEALKEEQQVCKEQCVNYELAFLCYRGSLSMPRDPLLLYCSCTDELKQGYADVPTDCRNGDVIARYGFSPVKIKDREIATQGKWTVDKGDKVFAVGFGRLGVVALAGLAISALALFAAGRLIFRGVRSATAQVTFEAVPAEEALFRDVVFARDGLGEEDADCE